MVNGTLYLQTKQILTQGKIPDGEASAIALILIEEITGLNRTQILTSNRTEEIAPTQRQRLTILAQQIAAGTPLQYALGYSFFCGMKFRVNPHVLIPRPETEELVEWVINTLPTTEGQHILDIGTGSGCIAITLAKRLPQAKVTALDISSEALQIAKLNARELHAEVDFLQDDILKYPLCSLSSLRSLCDAVVSNPPYICQSEAVQMEANVLDHEPHLALFVPDANPLLFYDAIARKALSLLIPGGYLFFEINRQYGSEVISLLQSLGYTNIQLCKDQFGNDRMIRAQMKSEIRITKSELRNPNC
ncbi:MAG: peptide chain release factor N(5)-glutamine methyltransferase [Bacteroidaceae bacterium]|nr:peptide chain release factor N(5)-glutamine methyltransferase [Bacteroidaceae bacterium]